MWSSCCSISRKQINRRRAKYDIMLLYQRCVTILLACLLFAVVYEISINNSHTGDAKLGEACRQIILRQRGEPSSITEGSTSGSGNNNKKAVLRSANMNDEETEVERLDAEEGEQEVSSSLPSSSSSSSSSSKPSSGVYHVEGVYKDKVNPPGTCVIDHSKMPDSWKPPLEGLAVEDSGKPWTKKEQDLLNDAAEKGLMELVNFYSSISKRRVKELFTNAANSVIDQCFSSSNMPHFQKVACETAAEVIVVVSEDLVLQTHKYWGCHNMHSKAKLLGYAHYVSMLFPGDVKLRHTRNVLSQRMQSDLDECGNLNKYMEVNDWESDLQNLNTNSSKIADYVHRSNVLTGLYTVPELQIPFVTELDRFTLQLWQYVAKYNFTYARDVKGGFDGGDPRQHAYLVTHAAYMPTGYGRHMQFVDDAPWLYKYIRENYYAAMDGLDLFAEFIDILRQYGCTEENDIHVRHGSRYLLNMYVNDGYSWMNHRDDDERENPSDYDLIHKPWTALAGVRRKQVEPIVPGSYGYSFQKALERAAAAELAKKNL